MKGKFVRTLKAVKAIGYLKPDRILQISGADGFVDKLFLPKSNFNILQQNTNNSSHCNVLAVQDDLGVDDETMFDDGLTCDVVDDSNNDEDDDKENMAPRNKAENSVNQKLKSRLLKVEDSEADAMCLTEFDKCTFRPPDMGASSLFDPNLLAAFEEAVMQVKAQEEADRRRRARVEEKRPIKSRKIEEIEEEMRDPLLDFEYKCPPSGGEDSVVLYTTGLRGIRKTFEDCSSVRFLLQSFRVLFFERDVSMHCEFKEELWRILGEKVVPPKLFIKGRYIGGAEVVLGLHEQGKLRCLFYGIPIDRLGGPCEGCGGFRFVVCFRCNGSRKIVDEDENQVVVQCLECNENGLLICPLCC